MRRSLSPLFRSLRASTSSRRRDSSRELDVLLKRRAITRWIGQNWARLSYSHFVEPVWLESNVLELPIPNLDPRLDGLRVLQLTDFHLCNRVPASHIRQAIELGRRQKCDLVALTGDYVHAGFRHVHAIAQLLSRLEAPLGVFAVLGNHDYSVRNIMGVRRYPTLPGTITHALQSAGIQVLRNESRMLEHHGAKVAVVGVADLWSRESDVTGALGGVDPDIPRIVLAHNPASVTQLSGMRCDLMLSGHTHGGQIQVPGLGPAMLSKSMREYAAGLYKHDSGYLYVNKGIGFTVRFRFKVRPEIAVFQFRAAKLDTL
ncbi:MAG: metallophosphoesterase [Planctomycetota bacterium]